MAHTFSSFLYIYFFACSVSEREKVGGGLMLWTFLFMGHQLTHHKPLLVNVCFSDTDTDTHIIDNRLSNLSLTNWVTQNSCTDFCLLFTHTSPMAGQNHHVVCHPSLRQLSTLDLKAVIHLFHIRRLTIQTALSHILNFLWYPIQIYSKIIMF